MIVEFCRYGNVHNFLLRHRNAFIDQIDRETDRLDPTIGEELLQRPGSMSRLVSTLNYFIKFFKVFRKYCRELKNAFIVLS